VLQYLNFAVSHYGIQIKLEHEVISMEEREDGWLLCVRGPIDTSLRFFDYVIVATGLFTEGKYRPQYPGGSTPPPPPPIFLSFQLLFSFCPFILLYAPPP
jgi:cation diffusion facilitator CzcD-associated flavoprotein CzcO